MFKDKKKRNASLPDLPGNPRMIPSMRDYDKTVPTYPEDEEYDKEVHSLPSFPDSPMQKGFSQSAIKEAINSEENSEDFDSEEMHSYPSFPDEAEQPNNMMSRTMEMEEWTPSSNSRSSINQMPSMSHVGLPRSMPPRLGGNKPVFVKLDKFKEARDSLAKVQASLNEVEDLLRQTREIKIREEHELAAWEKEMENIKARINSVNSQIFENPQE